MDITVDETASALVLDELRFDKLGRRRATATFSGQIGPTPNACPSVGVTIGGVDVFSAKTKSFGFGFLPGLTTLCLAVNRDGIFVLHRATGEFSGLVGLGRDLEVSTGPVEFSLEVDEADYGVTVDGKRKHRTWQMVAPAE